MSKNVLIISGSPRKDGNSETLCKQFAKGVGEAGHTVEFVRLAELHIDYPYAKECERTSIQQYHSEQAPTQPQEALDQSIPPTPSVTELPGQAPAASEIPPAKPKAPPAKPQAPAPKTPPSGDQPSKLPTKPAKRPKTLYESSRPPADF